MLKLKKIAVTGGLSCGKTTVCRIFKKLGAEVISADEVVHQLLTPETETGKSVIGLLGDQIISKRTIDRKAIAKRVFQDKNLLKSLEEILHPAVIREIENKYQECCQNPSTKAFVVEIPLYFEVVHKQCPYDMTIAVLSDREMCVKRFQKSTGLDEEEYNRRMQRQLSPEKKAEEADFVIVNNGTLEDLTINSQKVWESIIN